MGWDTRNLCHKFISQGPALKILDLRVASPKFQGSSSRVLDVRVPCPRVPESRVLGLRVPGPKVPGLRVLSPGSQVQILDYAKNN